MMIYWMTLGAVFGSWFGALLIPLDWDRPWQVCVSVHYAVCLWIDDPF